VPAPIPGAPQKKKKKQKKNIKKSDTGAIQYFSNARLCAAIIS
jgi:hypothetical protein